MNPLLLIPTIFVLTYFLLCLYQQYKQSKRLPPGPIGLPIIGSLLMLRKRTMPSFLDLLRQRYGSVVSVRLGQKLIVYLTDFDTARQAFMSTDFSGRPMDHFALVKEANGKGVIFSEGETWKVLRRFSMSSLRDLGVGKLSLEGKIMQEVDQLCAEFVGTKEQPFNPTHMTRLAVTNVIVSVVFGKRYEYSDETFLKLTDLMAESLKENPTKDLVSLIPMLERFAKFRKAKEEKQAIVAVMHGFIGDLMDEHRISREPGTAPRDFLDVVMDEASAENKETAKLFDDNLKFIVNQLFFAGSDTTASTMEWVLQILIKYPIVQNYLYTEISQYTDIHGRPTFERRSELPYLEAFLMEVQRIASIGVSSLPHCTTKDVNFKGYHIPKRTIVYAALTCMHYDRNYWPSPEIFDPRRFLNEDGSVNYRRNSYVPFSLGKRFCMGETLAKMELFLFTIGLVTQFKFFLPKGLTAPPAGRQFGLTVRPAPFSLRAIPREK